jgi:uncharacterized protein (DUF305 family)
MQININKKSGALIVIATLLVAGILGYSFNREGDDSFPGMHGNHSTSMDDSSATNSTKYTGADVMFLQMMIPHHQQAIDISNIALKTSKDSELLALARTIIKAQTREIVQMKSWLDNAGTSAETGHSMGMGGMLDDAELSALTAASGKSFDKLWLEGMIEHHDGAIHMTQMIEDAQNKEIKEFGMAIVEDQSLQIEQMKAMLTRLA